MGLLKKITKPLVKLVDHVVPGGRYLTGSEQSRQNRLYQGALNEHNNYASQAQNNIENFSRQLNEAMGRLESLSHQRQQHAGQSVQLQGGVEQYQRGMQSLEQHKMTLGNEANALYELFENFKSKAPNLANKISEVQKIPVNFNQMFDNVLQRKETLRGLTEDEAGGEIRRYRGDVENLKKSRAEMEQNIRKSMDEIVRNHAELGGERDTLENRLNSYGYAQNRLLQEADHFSGVRGQLETIIKNYQNEGTRLENEYNSSRSHAENLNNQLEDYSRNAQAHLENLANTVGFRAGKLQKASSNTGILRGLALAASTYGVGSYLAPAAAASGGAAGGASATAGGSGAAATSAASFGNSLLSSIGTGLRYAAPVVGMAGYMGAMNRMRGVIGLERVNLRENLGNYSNSLGGLTNRASGYDKIGLPDLGVLKQSLSHFGMPTVPKLQDLPKLSESLGKVVNPTDVESLGLGLPQMTSADGKKYSSEILYDMDFLKKLKKVSRYLSSPYLRSNAAGNNRVAYA